jgi:hypothetical protein
MIMDAASKNQITGFAMAGETGWCSAPRIAGK